MPEKSTFKQLILIALYRSPSSPFSTFATMIHKHITPLLSTTNSNNPVSILGEFNVNLLDPKHRDILINCPQYVKEATHNSGSLLDHVYWTGNSNLIRYEIIGCYWSDNSIVATHISYQDMSQLSPSPNLRPNECNILPNNQQNCSSLNSVSNTNQHSPFAILQLTALENDVGLNDTSEDSCLTAKLSSKDSINFRLRRMSITEEEDCFLTDDQSAQANFNSPSLNPHSFTNCQSETQNTDCPINVHLQRMSITEDDDSIENREPIKDICQ